MSASHQGMAMSSTGAITCPLGIGHIEKAHLPASQILLLSGLIDIVHADSCISQLMYTSFWSTVIVFWQLCLPVAAITNENLIATLKGFCGSPIYLIMCTGPWLLLVIHSR